MFEKLADVYDQVYADKDYPKEARYIDKLKSLYGNQWKTMLDIACGTGAHMEQLKNMGYEVSGLDISKEMLAKARKRLPEVNLINCSMDKMPISKYDLITCLFNAFGYLVENEKYVEFLSRVRCSLQPGGVFLFDCRSGIQAIKGYKKKTSNTIKKSTHRFDSMTSVFCSKHTFAKKIKETHYIRCFYPTELDFMLKVSGFRESFILSYGTVKKAGEKDWQYMVVAR